jgi:hypothetical protein
LMLGNQQHKRSMNKQTAHRACMRHVPMRESKPL